MQKSFHVANSRKRDRAGLVTDRAEVAIDWRHEHRGGHKGDFRTGFRGGTGRCGLRHGLRSCPQVAVEDAARGYSGRLGQAGLRRRLRALAEGNRDGLNVEEYRAVTYLVGMGTRVGLRSGRAYVQVAARFCQRLSDRHMCGYWRVRRRLIGTRRTVRPGNDERAMGARVQTQARGICVRILQFRFGNG